MKYCWWFRIPARKPPGMVLKPCTYSNGRFQLSNSLNWDVFSPDFWLPSTMYHSVNLAIHQIHLNISHKSWIISFHFSSSKKLHDYQWVGSPWQFVESSMNWQSFFHCQGKNFGRNLPWIVNYDMHRRWNISWCFDSVPNGIYDHLRRRGRVFIWSSCNHSDTII